MSPGRIKEQFVLIGAYRSGTSFVLDTIRQHPDLLVHGEIFQTANREWHINPATPVFLDLSRWIADPTGFVRRLLRTTNGKKAVGCKILIGQNDEAFEWVLRQHDIGKILIHRPNVLAQFASAKLAEKTNLWNHPTESGDPNEKILFEPIEFVKFQSWMKDEIGRIKSVLDDAEQAYAEVSYDPATVAVQARAALAWLGVDQASAYTSTLQRLYANDVVERFVNPDAVCATLERVGHPEWLRE